MKFRVIWESRDVGDENKYNYYFQFIHYGSAAKMSLLVFNTKNKTNMYNYALIMLENIKEINSDAGERNSRIVAVTFPQVIMYNYHKYVVLNND
jgi:hypothetical protein